VVNRKATIPVRAGEPWIYVKVQDGDASSSVVSNVTVKASASGLLSASAAIEFTVPPANAVKVTSGVQIKAPGGYDKAYRIAVEPGKRTTVNFQVQADAVDKKGTFRATVERIAGDALVNGRDTDSEMTIYTDENGKGSFTVQMGWLDRPTDIELKVDLNKDGLFDDEGGRVLVQVVVAETTVRTLDVAVDGKRSTFTTSETPAFTLTVKDNRGRTVTPDLLTDDIVLELTVNGGYVGDLKLDADGTKWDAEKRKWIFDWTDLGNPDKNDGETLTIGVYEDGSVYMPSDSVTVTFDNGFKVLKLEPPTSYDWSDSDAVDITLTYLQVDEETPASVPTGWTITATAVGDAFVKFGAGQDPTSKSDSVTVTATTSAPDKLSVEWQSGNATVTVTVKDASGKTVATAKLTITATGVIQVQ